MNQVRHSSPSRAILLTALLTSTAVCVGLQATQICIHRENNRATSSVYAHWTLLTGKAGTFVGCIQKSIMMTEFPERACNGL